jgi:hypothetical protein
MSGTGAGVLLGFFILATSVWLGGYIAIAIVARVATRTLSGPQRVAFFRSLGRVYGIVGTAALVVALGTGAGLASGHRWDGTLVAALVLAIAVFAALLVGMLQARRMTRLRRASLAEPDDATLAARVSNGARRAAMLRALIGALSLALVAVGTLLVI